jgi:hypothetical protein
MPGDEPVENDVFVFESFGFVDRENQRSLEMYPRRARAFMVLPKMRL